MHVLIINSALVPSTIVSEELQEFLSETVDGHIGLRSSAKKRKIAVVCFKISALHADRLAALDVSQLQCKSASNRSARFYRQSILFTATSSAASLQRYIHYSLSVTPTSVRLSLFHLSVFPQPRRPSEKFSSRQCLNWAGSGRVSDPVPLT